MSALTRRNFIGLAQNAVAVAAVGAIGVHFIEAAEAMPVFPDIGQAAISRDLVTQAQWGPRRRRRWVCWWHRGRRGCGWRWIWV